MTDYRFNVTSDGVIERASIYRCSDDSTWSHYWDGEGVVGYYDEGFRGRRPLHDNDEDTLRLMRALTAAETYGDGDLDDVLRKVARRITGNWDARFICVGLDRGRDFFVLAWSGDPDGEWRDEIEYVNWGEVYRCHVEQYTETLTGGFWLGADDMCVEWYGEDNAAAGLAAAFPLTEFPAELITRDSA